MSIFSFVRRAGPALALLTLIVGCGRAESNGSAQRSAEGARPSDASPSQPRRVVMFLGTSLTDGYGLERNEAYPARIQEKIDSAGLPWTTVNAGLSGEKSAGARQRIGWLLRQPFDVLVLETGANDMLQGTNVDSLRANLQSIIDTVRAARPNARIVLVGMRAAPNLGSAYVRRFDPTYPELAQKNGLTLIPFLLEGVAGIRDLNIADGVHPNARGHRILAATVWRTLDPILRGESPPPAAAPAPAN